MKIPQTIKLLTKQPSRLSQRIISASAWTLIMRISSRGIGFLRIIVLAHLLSPEAFGLVGVGLLGIDLVMTLSSTGFNNALIQKKEDIRGYLDTAWVISILRGFITAGLLYICAPLIATYFGSPEAKTIVQVMAFLVVIDGFRNSGIIYLQKELEIKKQFLFGISQSLTDLLITIPAAIILKNAWALVYGAIASNIVGLIVSYIIHPYRPRFKFDLHKAATLFNFGKWLTVSSWLSYFSQKGDSILVGNLAGVYGLGLYQMARRISDVYAFEFYIGTMNVTFPAFSKIQDNMPKLRQGFCMSLDVVISVIFPLGSAIFVLAPLFVPIVFGEQWIAAIPAMQILGISAAFQCILSLGRSLFLGLGQPRLSFLMSVIPTAVMFGSFIPLHHLFGLTGIAVSVLIGNICALPLFLFYSIKSMDIKPIWFLKILAAPLSISIVIIITSSLAVRYLSIQQEIIKLVLVLLLVGLSAFGIMFVLWKFKKMGPFKVINLIKK